MTSTGFIAPNLSLSTGQALETSQNPHTDPPLAAIVEPTHPTWPPWGVMSRNRWDDAETAPSPHGRRTERNTTRAWSPSAGSRRCTAIPASHMALPRTGGATAFAVPLKGFPSAVSRKGLSLARGRPLPPPWPHLPEAWHPPESNKGLSERLSAPGGKSARGRRESPSKTPKNGF